MNEPLQDWLFFCEDREVLSQTRYTKELKKYIDDIFRDKIGFYRTGKCVIVYSQNVNPCQYSMSTVKGFGLRADNIAKHFANLIKRDIPKFPCSPTELSSKLMKGPMCILFKTIFMTSYDKMKKNEFGYTFANSSRFTCKIENWQMIGRPY